MSFIKEKILTLNVIIEISNTISCQSEIIVLQLKGANFVSNKEIISKIQTRVLFLFLIFISIFFLNLFSSSSEVPEYKR